MIFHAIYADVPDATLDAFVRRQRVGRLVTAGAGGQPHIGLYPFLFLGDRLELHLNRADEQLADLRENPACAFEVDEVHGTIPSHWLHEASAVFATAYHRTVILEGRAELSDDAGVLAAQMGRLLAHYQPEGGHAPVAADDALYRAPLAMLTAVVVRPHARKVKWKLAQNRDRATRERVIALLRERGEPGDAAAAEALEWTLAHDAAQPR
ncbi:MAG: FMN-binding negative transcriptional regulator [Planctomycetaceae bacterium]